MVSTLAAADDAKTDAPARYTERMPDGAVTFEMVGVPGGVFTMGSPAGEKDRGDDEGPSFEVTVEPFWIGAREVTWGEYRQFMAEYGRLVLEKKGGRLEAEEFAPSIDAVSIPSTIRGELMAQIAAMGNGDEYPATFMTQYAARQYCKWLSIKTGRFYRLPTEAEWEYAARAGSATAWSFGDDPAKLAEHAWSFENSEWKDHPERGLPGTSSGYRAVGSLRPNAWGLFDMHGNVAEWCLDQHDTKWYAKFDGKRVAAAEAVNWPTKLYPRVLRGGSWDSDAADTRSAARLASTVNWHRSAPQLPRSLYWFTDAPMVGFRLVRPVKEASDAEKRKHWDEDGEELRELIKTYPDLMRMRVEREKAGQQENRKAGN